METIYGFRRMVLVIMLVVALPTADAVSNSGKRQDYGLLHQDEGIVLKIPQGLLKWNVSTSREGRDYFSFYNIPYASPPTGELRFESPQPALGWEGVRHEMDVAPQCIQKSKYSPIIEAVGAEDCLNLNIYTPKLPGLNTPPDGPLLPTLFYIHGGGFADGNGSRYGAQYFMDEDAVMVTIQYRLGSLGFLSSGDDQIKGNMGLKDQVQALNWVKDNIAYFGGDPDRVMIYGNSAGGSSVNLLVTSPMAAGLFHRAVTQSGPPFGPLIQSKEVMQASYEGVVRAANCTGSSDWVACLRSKTAAELAVIREDDVVYAVVVEEHNDTVQNFLPDTFGNLFAQSKVNLVPWIIGATNAEWIGASAMHLRDHELVNQLNNNWTTTFPVLTMNPCLTSPVSDVISDGAKNFYFGNSSISNETMTELTNALSDRDIVHASARIGQWMATLGQDVFLYVMSKRPAKSYADPALIGYPPGDYGASHADELQFLFNYYGYPEYDTDSEYYSVSRQMVKFWVEFAATGRNPAPEWEPIGREGSLFWFELNDNPTPTMAPMGRMAFWSQFSDTDLCYN